MPKVVLLILDGFGLGNGEPNVDAISTAKLPFLRSLFREYPWTKLDASGPAVGLHPGQFGNSEIGHMTIGAGRILPNLDEILLERIENFHSQFRPDETIHIVGIYSDGLIHGDKRHIDALIKYFTQENRRVVLHLISDGRDTKKYVFLDDLQKLLSWIDPKLVSIGSISGRFYAMDRDKNWERTRMAYDAMNGTRKVALDPVSYVREQYARGMDDEILPPASFQQMDLQHGTFIFTNYRSDRIVQLITFCQEKNLQVFTLSKIPTLEKNDYLFNIDTKIPNTLDEILCAHGLSQLRVAETEKYAHVTYFFDGGREAPNPLKQAHLIPSNKIVSHANEPEMKAVEITDFVLAEADKYDVIVVNYANADMLGHTGNFAATVAGLEVLDQQIERIYNKIIKRFGCWLVITADHGNADQMLSKDGEPLKTHTTALVPFLITDRHVTFREGVGNLSQIAPTILAYLGIPKPIEMTSDSLLSGEPSAKN